ncbi:MAG: hypothetical protein Kow00123_02850 [Anaerolineales bacterium]
MQFAFAQVLPPCGLPLPRQEHGAERAALQKRVPLGLQLFKSAGVVQDMRFHRGGTYHPYRTAALTCIRKREGFHKGIIHDERPVNKPRGPLWGWAVCVVVRPALATLWGWPTRHYGRHRNRAQARPKPDAAARAPDRLGRSGR